VHAKRRVNQATDLARPKPSLSSLSSLPNIPLSMPNQAPTIALKPHPVAGRRVLVVGLGRFGGGVGVTRWLVAQGAKVTVTDQAAHQSLTESVEAIADLPVALHLGTHDEHDLDSTDLVIVNPAVNKSTSDFFQALVRRGIPWTTEMNLFCERCPATVIGVTGSYGKSTTCAMLAEVFEAARRAGAVSFRAVHLGGNIGRSLLSELDVMDERDLVVLEMSNAQLEDQPRINWAPDVAVITNLFPHHLDRYGSFAGYVQAKLNIVRDPTGRSPVIVGELHPEAEPLLTAALEERVYQPMKIDRRVPVVPADPPVELRVPGRHNQMNAACVLTVCRVIMGRDESVARKALAQFRGLPHRLEHVRNLKGVDYYNDSKSTAPAATIIALEAIADSPEPRISGCVESPRKIVTIVGGQRKEVSLSECATTLARYCRVVICMGESGADFAQAVQRLGAGFRPPKIHAVAALPEAVRLAHAEAKPGDVVLFSPGAPSFDQYANFTERGAHFSELVQAL